MARHATASPPIDDPEFVSVAEAAEWIRPEEPVIALTVDGDTRAYPLQVLGTPLRPERPLRMAPPPGAG